MITADVDILSDAFSRIVTRATDGVVQVVAGPRGLHQGAGVVWARNGTRCLVVSNAHVATAPPVVVTGRDGVQREARLLARTTARDLALLYVDDAPAAWRPVPPSTATPRVGQVVMAIGHPLGVRHAVSTGVVHAIGPLADAVPLPIPARAHRWAQLDLRLAPGNSGGPVVDSHGNFVAVSTMIVGGLGLAIPADDVDRFAHDSGGPHLLGHGWTREG